MSSGDTNSWSNFCDPHWELICLFGTLTENSTENTQGPRKYHTTRNSCRDALPCANMALKLPRYFYMLMEKPPGCYFQVQSPYYQAAQCNQKTPILVSSKWQVRSEKAKKRIITATTGVHLAKPVSTNILMKARFSCNQPYRKRWGVKLVDVKDLPHKVFLLWHHH